MRPSKIIDTPVTLLYFIDTAVKTRGYIIRLIVCGRIDFLILF